MIVVKTVYVKKLPPKNTIIHLQSAISSCSPEEIKRPNPSPDLHYFEIYWYTKVFGGAQKNILRFLYPTYQMAVEEHDRFFEKMFGNTEDWVDAYYEPQIRSLQKELKISRENRRVLENWRQKYEQSV